MEGLIVYKSKYGATRQYAEWLGQSLKVPVSAIESLNREQLSTTNQVIIGTSVYVGKMLIHPWILQNQDYLRNKRVFLFVVCGTPASDRQAVENIIKNNLPGDLADQFSIFFLPGRLIHGKLSWIDRVILALGSMRQKDPEKKKAMRADYNGVKRENLDPLLKAIGANQPAVAF